MRSDRFMFHTHRGISRYRPLLLSVAPAYKAKIRSISLQSSPYLENASI